MAGVNERVVGKCSICGGEVVVPVAFHSTEAPVPSCRKCGAVAHTTADLPVIPMKPGSLSRNWQPWNEEGWNSEEEEQNYYPD